MCSFLKPKVNTCLGRGRGGGRSKDLRPIPLLPMNVDLVGRHALEGGALDTHLHLEREAPDVMVADGILPILVHEAALHDGELVAVLLLDHLEVAVHGLAVVVLCEEPVVEVLVAD